MNILGPIYKATCDRIIIVRNHRDKQEKDLLPGGQEVLFLVLFNARTARLHLQRRGRGLLSSRLNKVSKHLCLLQQVLESVGAVCFLVEKRQRV